MIGSTRALLKVALAVIAAVAVQPAWAQGEANYPTKPIRVVVGLRSRRRQ